MLPSRILKNLSIIVIDIFLLKSLIFRIVFFRGGESFKGVMISIKFFCFCNSYNKTTYLEKLSFYISRATKIYLKFIRKSFQLIYQILDYCWNKLHPEIRNLNSLLHSKLFVINSNCSNTFIINALL